MTDFADKNDISNGWRALTPAEEIDVPAKIAGASTSTAVLWTWGLVAAG